VCDHPPVSSYARTIFTLAGVLGAATVIATATTLGADRLGDALSLQYANAFAGNPWHFAPPLAYVLVSAAIVVSGVEWLLRRTKRGLGSGGPLAGLGTEAILTEVREQIARSIGPELIGQSDPDVIGACEALLRGAFHLRASDLHVSPTPEGINITYRVDSELVTLTRLRASALSPLVTRLKVLAKLDTYIRNVPQDGRLAINLDGQDIEARVSTLPTEMGERVVLRFVSAGREVPAIEKLGFASEVQTGLLDVLSRPQGLFFVTGPVGSGKTTTLYAALQHISRSRGKNTTQVTLEDPIEIELPFATQTQIHPKSGMTFAGTLRSVLRQDPNVLMVGEIRDRETAEIAMQAGLTGHLILTTVHGQSAAGAFARLIEMGIEPFLLGSATVGSLSQRLVRTLCPQCRKVARPSPDLIAKFTEGGLELSPDTKFYEPVGCPQCEGQGYAGRTPIGELLKFDERVRVAVRQRAPTSEIENIAIENGMTTLLADGLACASRGETSLLEVLRVAR
jgi:general secretion pathway protein E